MARKFLRAFICSLFIVFSVSFYANAYTDVKETDWFYTDVSQLSKKGIIEGYPDNSFRPSQYITRAEFIKLLCQVCGFDSMGGLYFKDTFLDSSNRLLWHHKYVSAALSSNILYRDEEGERFYPDTYISRLDMAKYVSRALSLKLQPYASPYTDTKDDYILSLFQSCIMNGTLESDGETYFYPDKRATRAECAAVINRVYSYLSSGDKFVNTRRSELSLVPLPISNSPKEKHEFFRMFEYMSENYIAEMTFEYPIAYNSEYKNRIITAMKNAYSEFASTHPEYSVHIIMFSEVRGTSDSFTLKLYFSTDSYSGDFDSLVKKQKTAENKANEIVKEIIKDYMSTGEKLAAIHDYIVLNSSYKEKAPSDDDFTAYGVLVNKTGVCEGYSAAFNLLCRAASVKSISVRNTEHSWNVSVVSGETLHYDATFDDPVPDVEGKVLHDFCGVDKSVIAKNRKYNSFDISSID